MPHRHRTPTAVRALGACSLLAAALALPACGAFSKSDVDYARAYPFEAEREDVLDVQVFRDGTKIRMTNATARSFGPSTLWVNQRFSRPIEGFASGQTVTVSLHEFRDQYQDQFRAGGFFAIRDPDPVVLVELEPGDADAGAPLYGFVVVDNKMN